MNGSRNTKSGSKDHSVSIKSCKKCGHKGPSWDGKCPNCGGGEGREEDHIYGWHPISVVFRFLATAILFGLPTALFLLKAGLNLPLFVYIAIPIIWGVTGIFLYDRITSLGSYFRKE